MLQSTQGGVWISNSTQENAVASFACGMDYVDRGYCPPKTCRDGTWSPSQQCDCEKITTTMSSSVQITHSTTTTLTDNFALLKSISSAVQMMWLTVGGGVAIIMIVVLVTACVICSKMRYFTSLSCTSPMIGFSFLVNMYKGWLLPLGY